MGTIRSVAAGAIVLLCGCSTTGENAAETDAGDESQSTAGVDPTKPMPGESGETVDALSSRSAPPEDGGATQYQVTSDVASVGPGGVTRSETVDVPSSHDGGSLSDLSLATSSSEMPTEASDTDAGTVVMQTCRETAGLCDPIGECAIRECDFEETGKSCSYTPGRTYPFMCVGTANYEPYRPCDSDDVCAPGSVCISKVAILKDGSFYRRPGAVCRQTCRQDDECGDGEWCAQATDDNNEVIPDLRVCHRHCSSEADCYEGEGDDEVRCSNSVEGAPPSTYECSRYRPPVEATTEGVTSAGGETEANGLTQLSFRAYALQASSETCVFIDDCAEGEDCVDGTCSQRCETSANCDGTECVWVNGRGVCGAACEVPPDGECGIVPSNCGCSPGLTCQLDSTLTPSCAAPGVNPAMTWCNTSQDCDSGLSCMAGLCRALCNPETHPCSPGEGECLLSVSRGGEDVYACGGSCDPVTPGDGRDTGCGLGAVCIPGFDTSRHHQALCASERVGHAPNAQGESCTEDYDCVPGLGCDDNGTCQEWCRTENDCPTAYACAFSTGSRGSVPRFGPLAEDRVGLCRDGR